MIFEKFLKLLVPKDKIFYPLLKQDVENLIGISELLILLIKDEIPEKRLEYITKIKEFEKKAMLLLIIFSMN